jgi:sortase A
LIAFFDRRLIKTLMAKATDKKRNLKTLILILEFLVLGLIIYLIAMPFYPGLKFRLSQMINKNTANGEVAEQAKEPMADQGPAELKDNIYRVKIAKIGVDIPVIESKNSDYALSKGAWRLPETSTPDKGGNTVISAHRFKYLPPSSETFYLLDKLEAGDLMTVFWAGKKYQYRVATKKIIPPEDLSILEPTQKPILTLFTCDPIYSEKNRLVVIGELVE